MSDNLGKKSSRNLVKKFFDTEVGDQMYGNKTQIGHL